MLKTAAGKLARTMVAREDRVDEPGRARIDGNRTALDAAAGWRYGVCALRVERATAKSFRMDVRRIDAFTTQSIGSVMVGEMQEKLYEQDVWAVLLIFQGRDAEGRDGEIKQVMSRIKPKGCDVYAFKEPTNEELEHDFLWREHKLLPSRGKIGIFNR